MSHADSLQHMDQRPVALKEQMLLEDSCVRMEFKANDLVFGMQTTPTR